VDYEIGEGIWRREMVVALVEGYGGGIWLRNLVEEFGGGIRWRDFVEGNGGGVVGGVGGGIWWMCWWRDLLEGFVGGK
jgi:hypothetical protein